MALHQKTGNQKQIANCLIYFGKIHEEENPDSTIFFGTEALRIAQETGNKAEKVRAAELLYKTYQSEGKYKKAFEMHELFQDTKDSIYGIRNQKAVFKNELAYQEEKKKLKNEIRFEKQLRESQLRMQRQRFIFFGVLGLLVFTAGFYIRRRQIKNIEERNNLLAKVEDLKQQLSRQSITSPVAHKKLSLDKEKIEKAIDNRIGESSWRILNLIFNNPSISNKEIAEEVSLSVEGVSSSLRRMYTVFGITSTSNKKITLIMKATRISLEE